MGRKPKDEFELKVAAVRDNLVKSIRQIRQNNIGLSRKSQLAVCKIYKLVKKH